MEDKSKVEEVKSGEELVFGDTTDFYMRVFAEGSAKHPAKMNISFLTCLITRYTTEGETILDCFGGTGSTGYIAALLKRRSVLVEIEPVYVKLISDTMRKIAEMWRRPYILQGDARTLRKGLKKAGWPTTLSIQTIITSPPYADMLKSVEMVKGGYSYQDGQLGRMPLPEHLVEVEKVYQECYAVLGQGQKMILVVRNYIRKGSVVDYVYETYKLCEKVGFKLVDVLKMRLPKLRAELTDYYATHPFTDQVLHEYALVFVK